MHLKIFTLAAVATLAMLFPARADAQCCDHAKASCCTEATANCCDKDVNILAQLPVDMTLSPAPPVRQLTEVWFQRPTRVGKNILQGRYVIEHDNDRMARGEPCTYIYAYNNQTKPVVTFHCTHIERAPASNNVVVLETQADMAVMQEFQFAGETAAHGVPAR
jgi:hypothetical protein